MQQQQQHHLIHSIQMGIPCETILPFFAFHIWHSANSMFEKHPKSNTIGASLIIFPCSQPVVYHKIEWIDIQYPAINCTEIDMLALN